MTIVRYFLVLSCVMLCVSAAYAADLTAGGVYTITVQGIDSDGQVVDVGITTTATANNAVPPKLFFTLSGVPTTASYNFLVVTVKDNTGAVVRKSIVPAAAPGGSVDLGISPMTKTQADALLQAMQSAGSDDPTLVLFGSIIIRSGALSDADVDNLGEIGRRSILGPNGDNTVGGFNYYMINNADVGLVKLGLFRNAIVTKLRDYTSELKEAVDATTDAESKNRRGEACAMLSRILIEAADEAGFDVSYITSAMKAASDQQEQYLCDTAAQNTIAGALITETAVSAMDAVMISNYTKLKAEALRKKYQDALTELGASDAQITQVNNAVTTLSDALVVAFQTMEEAFADEDAALDQAVIDAKRIAANNAMQAAFDQFYIDLGSSKADLDNMVVAMKANFCASGAGGDTCRANLDTMKGTDSDADDVYDTGQFCYRYLDSGNNTKYINWPVTIVVPVTWAANNHPADLTYTRDTLAIPLAGWIDSDGNAGNGKTRHDFGTADDNGIGADEWQMPTSLATIMGLREDIEILTQRKWGAEAAASRDMVQATYDALTGDDLTDANDHIPAEGGGDTPVLVLIAAEDTALADENAGAAYSDFNLIDNLAPYLTGAEAEDIVDLYLSHVDDRKAALGPAGLTEAERQALADLCTMPDF